MYYADKFQAIFSTLSDFLSKNQMVILAVLFIGAYFLKRFVDYLAARPQVDMWDSIKPGTDAFYALIHKGVDMRAKVNPTGPAAKLEEYLEQIQKFERLFAADRIRAIKELAAWYLSIKAKVETITANPSIGPDDLAT